MRIKTVSAGSYPPCCIHEKSATNSEKGKKKESLGEKFKPFFVPHLRTVGSSWHEIGVTWIVDDGLTKTFHIQT